MKSAYVTTGSTVLLGNLVSAAQFSVNGPLSATSTFSPVPVTFVARTWNGSGVGAWSAPIVVKESAVFTVV